MRKWERLGTRCARRGAECGRRNYGAAQKASLFLGQSHTSRDWDPASSPASRPTLFRSVLLFCQRPSSLLLTTIRIPSYLPTIPLPSSSSSSLLVFFLPPPCSEYVLSTLRRLPSCRSPTCSPSVSFSVNLSPTSTGPRPRPSGCLSNASFIHSGAAQCGYTQIAHPNCPSESDAKSKARASYQIRHIDGLIEAFRQIAWC